MLIHQRRLYEKMMDDMQAHAESQPVLKLLKPGKTFSPQFKLPLNVNESTESSISHNIYA